MFGILCECTGSWWMFYVNVQDYGEYFMRMWRIMVDILCKCAGSWWIFYASLQDHRLIMQI